MIVCDLSERVCPCRHPAVASDSALIILDCIKHRTAVEPLCPGFRSLTRTHSHIIVLSCLVRITKNQKGLRNKSRSVRLAVSRHSIHHCLSICCDKNVVAEHKAALHNVIIRYFAETAVLHGLLEPRKGLVKGAFLIVHISEDIS